LPPPRSRHASDRSVSRKHRHRHTGAYSRARALVDHSYTHTNTHTHKHTHTNTHTQNTYTHTHTSVWHVCAHVNVACNLYFARRFELDDFVFHLLLLKDHLPFEILDLCLLPVLLSHLLGFTLMLKCVRSILFHQNSSTSLHHTANSLPITLRVGNVTINYLYGGALQTCNCVL